MNIAVLYKWARDPESAAVRSDGSVDWRGAKMTAGEDDPAALEGATTLAAATGARVIGITIGDGDASWALARGVEEAYSVTDAPSLDDQATTGQILATAVRRAEVDVVAIGDAQQYRAVPMALAGALGWPILLNLTSATAENGRIVATRRGATGQERLTVDAPVVLAFSAEAEEKKVPGMKEMLMARKRPVTALTLDELGMDATERVVSQGTRAPKQAATRIFDGNPDEAAQQLIDALRAEGVLS